MKAIEIREKLAKANEVVIKKENTLKKHEAKAEKIKNQIIAKGWDIEAGKYQKHEADGSMETEEAHDCYWTFCDLAQALEDIERTKDAIEEKKAIVAKWEDKLAEAIEKESVAEQFPEIFKKFQEHVIEMWNRWDMNKRESLRKEYARMRAEDSDRQGMNAYREFIKKYRYTGYEFMSITDEEINKENTKASEKLIMNLWNRIKEIVGEATDYSGLYITQGNEWEGVVVNGMVEGTDGKAIVETIGAGGYNIQKFHYRTLVKRA